ncbi:MAG TPA: radical SAM protein [Acidobacteriaceae bacterium]|nr:radical SAM protein [Acidobacteriaceae bacterium]
MSARYSTLKALKFYDRIEAMRGGRVAGPVHVQLILSDLCNQSCHFCAYRDPKYTSSQLFHIAGNYNPNRMLPFDKVVEILDDCAELGVKAIQLTGGGEPSVYPRFDDVVDAIVERGMQWALVTNGVIQKWDYSSAAWVRVSIDAGDGDTYSKIRSVPRGHWEAAWKTVRKYRCGVGFVVTPENWGGIYQAARTAKECGASNIRIGAQFSEEGASLFDGIAESAAALVLEAQMLADDNFEVINRFDEKLSELDQGAPDYERCGYQHFTTYIGADQNLYRCCVYAYNERGKIASLQGRRFKDVWRETAMADFGAFDARGCARCQFNHINRNINEVLVEDASACFV